MQISQHVIEVRQIAEPINQQFPVIVPDAKGQVSRHTHSSLITSFGGQVSEQAESSFSEQIVMPEQECRTDASGMRLLSEW